MSAESLHLIEAEKLNRLWALVDFDGVIADNHGIVRELISRKLGLDIDQVLATGRRSYWLPEWPEIQAIPGGVAFCHRLFRRREVYGQGVALSRRRGGSK